MSDPTMTERIVMLRSVVSHLETAVSLLRNAYPQDPQLGSAAQAMVEKTHIDPLLKEIDATNIQIEYLGHWEAIQAVECATCMHVRGLHRRSGCNGVVEVDEGMKPKPCQCSGFAIVGMSTFA